MGFLSFVFFHLWTEPHCVISSHLISYFFRTNFSKADVLFLFSRENRSSFISSCIISDNTHPLILLFYLLSSPYLQFMNSLLLRLCWPLASYPLSYPCFPLLYLYRFHNTPLTSVLQFCILNDIRKWMYESIYLLHICAEVIFCSIDTSIEFLCIILNIFLILFFFPAVFFCTVSSRCDEEMKMRIFLYFSYC